jgi:hypothetical protein
VTRAREIAVAVLLAALGFATGVTLTLRWIDEVTSDWRIG